MGGDPGSGKPADGGGQDHKVAPVGGREQPRRTQSENRGAPGSKEKPAGDGGGNAKNTAAPSARTGTVAQGATAGVNPSSGKPANSSAQSPKPASSGSNDQHRRTGSESHSTPGPKEKPADGEAKREEHGGFLRADARWVILLSVLCSAVTVLAYVGVQWSTLVHVFIPPATSSSSPTPRPSPHRSPSAAIQSPQPAAVLPFVSSSSPAPPSSAQASSSPAVVPSDFDSVATDPTDVDTTTMLPQDFNESGTVFTLTSSTMKDCPTGEESASVSGTLTSYGCLSEIIGTYLDSSQQIQVTVWVVPFPNKTDAEGAYNTLKPSFTVSNWGIWCPTNTAVVGSQVCQGDSWQNASHELGMGTCHRYLIRTLALYVDLASPSGAQPDLALQGAVQGADGAIGTQNVPVAAC